MTTQTAIRRAVAALLLPAPALAQSTFTMNPTVDPGDGTCDASECVIRVESGETSAARRTR